MNYFLLVNTSSNSGKSKQIIQRNEQLIKSYLPDSEIRFLEEDELIEDIISSIGDKFDAVVACGGDGTINAVASSLRHQNTLLGVLPIGTGNDFSKSIGLSKSLEENLKILKKAETKPVDLIQVNDSFFINTLGIGFDGETNYLATRLPNWLSSFRYMFAGVIALKTAKKFIAVIKQYSGESIIKEETKMIVVANGKWEGSKYLISPSSNPGDGEIELIYTKSVSTFRLVIEFLKLSLGFPLSSKFFETLRGQEFLVETTEPVYVHKDGELMQKSNSFHLRVFPEQLKVIA